MSSDSNTNLQNPESTPKEAGGPEVAAVEDKRAVDDETQKIADRIDDFKAPKDGTPKSFVKPTKTDEWDFGDLGSFEPPKPPGDTPRGSPTHPISSNKPPPSGPKDPPPDPPQSGQ